MRERDTVAVDGRSEREEGPRARGQKALAFVKSHGIEIAFGVGCLVLTVVCVKQGRTIELQRKLLEKKDALLSAKDWRILASAALRDGCSEGGRTLADYRYQLSGQL